MNTKTIKQKPLITGTINNFSFKEMKIPLGDPRYTAPEAHINISVLVGEVYDHDVYSNGQLITTSEIKEIRNGNIYTGSGSCYKLKTANLEYVNYCNNNGLKVFPDNIKICY